MEIMYLTFYIAGHSLCLKHSLRAVWHMLEVYTAAWLQCWWRVEQIVPWASDVFLCVSDTAYILCPYWSDAKIQISLNAT